MREVADESAKAPANSTPRSTSRLMLEPEASASIVPTSVVASRLVHQFRPRGDEEPVVRRRAKRGEEEEDAAAGKIKGTSCEKKKTAVINIWLLHYKTIHRMHVYFARGLLGFWMHSKAVSLHSI